MASAVEERLSRVAAVVSTRAPEVSEDIVALLVGEIPALRDEPRVVSLLGASVAENVSTLLHVVEHGIDPGRVEAPAAAIEYARRLAQRGVPMLALVRAYRIGQARFLRFCFEELGDDGGDARVRAEATRVLTELSFTYIDRISEQVIVVYEQERERWLNNRATVRVTRHPYPPADCRTGCRSCRSPRANRRRSLRSTRRRDRHPAARRRFAPRSFRLRAVEPTCR